MYFINNSKAIINGKENSAILSSKLSLQLYRIGIDIGSTVQVAFDFELINN